MDVTLRLETIVHDIERTREPILIVGEMFNDNQMNLLFLLEKTNTLTIDQLSPPGYPQIALRLLHGFVARSSTLCKYSP